MKQTFGRIMFLLCFATAFSCRPNKTFTESEVSLIPRPKQMTMGNSSFKLKKSTSFVVENVDQQMIARQFADWLEKPTGWKFDIVIGGNPGNNQIFFKTELAMNPEAYSLEVGEKRIEIKAAKPAGFFYAVQTLRQLLPAEIERDREQTNIEWLIPETTITDGPVFKWRGLMLDVSRHFFPKEDIFRIIDLLALHKINTLHLHLSDDQGWRIEIKKYPRLTELGAWRVDRENQHWNSRAKQASGEKATYGGFYTHEDIKEMVDYALKRFITIVPEIEMPAHAISALAAYPQYSCTGGPFTVLPGGVWPITDIYCAGNDSTFGFIENILNEVIELFPSRYIHVGGDEATKTEWKNCPKCKNRIKTEGLKNEEELQSYFIKRVEKFIRSKGKILVGWDEILEGGLPPEATVMSWRGFNGGIEAANLGHDVVMTPSSDCYIDYYQGPIDQEPLAIGGYLPLSKVYGFSPVPDGMSAEAAKHILGGQANLWTEYVPNLKHAEYMIFPRMASMAEALWSPKETRNWDDFSQRIKQLMHRYDQLGINYSKSAFKVLVKAQIDRQTKQINVNLKSEISGSEIRYTIDGSEPTNLSPVYERPIVIDKTATIKAIAFNNGYPSERSTSQSFYLSKSTFKPIKYEIPASEYNKGSGESTLVNAVRGTTNHQDGEWQGWLSENMELVINLGEATEISRISVGTLQNAEVRIFFPRKVECFISDDGITFQKIGETASHTNQFSEEKLLKDYSFSFSPIKVRFIKLVAQNLGTCPAGHEGEGKGAWLFVDEIMVD